MRRMTLLITGIGLTLASLALAQRNDTPQENLLFVIDRSGSMGFELPKIKQTVQTTVKALPRNHQAGLIHFSGCSDKDIVYDPPMKVNGGRAVASKVSKLQASGSTALAKAIERAIKEIETARVCPKMLLFTDNYDTCDGDPQQIRERFSERSEDLCLELDILSSAEDEETLRQLEELAVGLGGNLHRVQSEEDMLEAIRRIRERQRQGGGTTFDPDNPDNSGGDNGDDNDDDDVDESETEREREREGNGSSGSGSSDSNGN